MSDEKQHKAAIIFGEPGPITEMFGGADCADIPDGPVTIVGTVSVDADGERSLVIDWRPDLASDKTLTIPPREVLWLKRLIDDEPA